MRRYLLDTNAMGHFINRRRGVDQRVGQARVQGSAIGTCLPVVAELFFGVEYSLSRDKNRKRLVRALTSVVCWPFDRGAAEKYGDVAAELKRAGRLIQQVDIMVAAIALCLADCTVVTSDAGLSAVPGLSVEDWVRP